VLPAFNLSGKVAIVTGSTRGIGRGLAEGLAKSGANIVVVSRNGAACEQAAAEIAAFGVKTLAVPADLTRIGDIQNIVTKSLEVFPAIDILVNNAGNALTRRAEDVTEDEWDQVVNLDLKGVFFCCQAVGREMIKQKHGKIINVSSILGLVGEKLVAPYCAAKGGVIQVTRALALEWARYNIQVNALCPGYVETSINAEELKNEKVRQYIVGKTAAKRLGNVEDMQGAVVYLASEGSNYMTGQTMTVDGGWSAQ
jgi:NAD(P)-dependent dehydrogenase (short-subunit alcohol dehydrogenase family)